MFVNPDIAGVLGADENLSDQLLELLKTDNEKKTTNPRYT